MTWLIAVLAYACFAVFGLLVSLWLSWRIEDRAERCREYRAVPPGGLISGGGSACRHAPGGPDYPDWPRSAAVTFDGGMITQRAEPGNGASGQGRASPRAQGEPRPLPACTNREANREMRDTWT